MPRTNKEKSREYQRKYRAANREKLLERDREAARRRRAASPEVREKARVAARKWYALNKKRAAEASKRWRAENTEKVKGYSSEWAVKNREKTRASSRQCKTSWPPTRYEERLAKQQGLCAICGRPMKRAYADHDHATGQPRELLCPRCNTGLGFVERDDFAEWLEAVLTYIEKWKGSGPNETAVVKMTSVTHVESVESAMPAQDCPTLAFESKDEP
jgi:hypothetical protein